MFTYNGHVEPIFQFSYLVTVGVTKNKLRVSNKNDGGGVSPGGRYFS